MSIRNTILLMVLYIPFLMVGGLFIALALHHQYLRCGRIFRTAVFLPYITTPVAIGIIFGLLFDRNIGVVNNTLSALGFEHLTVNWLGRRDLARGIVSTMVIWRYIGYHAIIFLGGLSTISRDLIDAALVDGASPVRRLFSVVLPSLKPVVLFLFITDIIGGFQLIEEPMLLFTGWATGTSQIGGPGRGSLTAVWYLYDSAFIRGNNLGLGSAIGYGLFLFIIVFSIIGLRVVKGRSDE